MNYINAQDYNFNIYNKGNGNEYELFSNLTKEVINLYGVNIKYYKTKRSNKNFIIGENSHLVIDNNLTFRFNVMLETKEDFGDSSNLYTKFGLQSSNIITCFIHKDDFYKIHKDLAINSNYMKIDDNPIGNIIEFDNGSLYEITDYSLHSDKHGVNNLFSSNLSKNVYSLTLKNFIFNSDEFKQKMPENDVDCFDHTKELLEEDFGKLKNIFENDKKYKDNVETRTNTVDKEVVKPSENREKPLRNKLLDKNPFGEFG